MEFDYFSNIFREDWEEEQDINSMFCFGMNRRQPTPWSSPERESHEMTVKSDNFSRIKDMENELERLRYKIQMLENEISNIDIINSTTTEWNRILTEKNYKLSNDIKKMEENNRKQMEKIIEYQERLARIATLSDEKDCCICLDRKVTIVFVPCGHLIVCEDCSKQISNAKQECPICRNPVRQHIKIYK